MKDKIKKILNKPVWGKSPSPKRNPHAEEVAKLKSELKEAQGRVSVLRVALKSCWKISRHCECGERVTKMVIEALADSEDIQKSAKKSGAAKK